MNVKHGLPDCAGENLAEVDAVSRAKRDLQFLVLDEAAFAAAPKKSIDYAVMEHTRKAAVIPADIGWSDVGAWSAVRSLKATSFLSSQKS